MKYKYLWITAAVLIIIGASILLIYLNRSTLFIVKCEDNDNSTFMCYVDSPRGYDARFGIPVVNYCVKQGDLNTMVECAKKVYKKGDCRDLAVADGHLQSKVIGYCRPTKKVQLEEIP